MSGVKIKIESLYKIFGKNPKEGMEHVKNGIGKDELLAKYSHVLGLQDINLNIEEVLGLTILSSIVTSMPLAPAAIGTYHLAVVYCLNGLYGVSLEDAQVAAVVMHSIFFVYTIIFGYVYLLTESIDIKSITNDKEN